MEIVSATTEPWPEIDLGALAPNYRALKAAGHGAELMAVVKADAYGHGAIEVSTRAARRGLRPFRRCRVCEARELRAAGVRERIYLARRLSRRRGATDIVSLDLTPFVYDVGADRAA